MEKNKNEEPFVSSERFAPLILHWRKRRIKASAISLQRKKNHLFLVILIDYYTINNILCFKGQHHALVLSTMTVKIAKSPLSDLWTE